MRFIANRSVSLHSLKGGPRALALLCALALTACGSLPAVTPSAPAPATQPATQTALPLTATPAPAPGVSSSADCGAYKVTQEVTAVLDTGRVTRVSVHDAQGKEVKQVALDTSQGGMVEISQVGCGALAGDSAPSLLVESYTGGANCCFVYDLYALTPTLPSLLHWEARKGGIQTFAMLNGQPPYQIVGVDDRLADLDLLPRYATPELPVVFTLRAGQYVRATQEFPQVLRDSLNEAMQAIPTCNQDEICERSQAVRAYALGHWLGQDATTLANLKAALSPAVYTWLQSVGDKVTQALAE